MLQQSVGASTAAKPQFKSLVHLSIVAALLFVEFTVGNIWSIVYHAAVRPALLRQGARPCTAVSRPDAQLLPDCDLVQTRESGGILRQTFYSSSGSARKTVTLDGRGVVVESSTFYISNLLRVVLPALAFIPLLIAVVHKMLRTGSLFTWQLSRHEWDRLEKTLLLYSAPIVLGGILALWVGA